VMKIVDRGTAATGSADVARAQESARAGRAETRRAGSGAGAGIDTVELSSAAGQARRALDASSAARTQRVTELQAAYRSGAYTPDSRETSRGIIRDALAQGVQ